MNILIDYLASNTGGGKTVAENQIKYLAMYDKKNTYYILIKKGSSIAKGIDNKNFNIIEIDFKNLFHRLFIQFIILPKYIKEWSIDILFCPNNFIWYYKKNIYKITLYQDSNLFYKGYVNKNIFARLKYFFIRKLTYKALKKSDINIFVSDYIKGKREGTVNYLGIENDLINVEKAEKKYDISLIVSNFSEQKNLDILFDTVRIYYEKYNRKLKIIIIGGDRDTERFNLYKNKFENCKYANFTITGLVPQKEAYYKLIMSKLCFSPSILESFSIVPFEAVKLNIPILLSNIPIYKELWGDFDIYIAPHNAKEIADKIHWIFENYDKYYKMNMKIKEYIKKYSWENHITNLIDIFNLIGKK